MAAAIDGLDVRLKREQKTRALTKKEALVMRLHQQYPNDVGVLSAFFLNLVELQADQVGIPNSLESMALTHDS